MILNINSFRIWLIRLKNKPNGISGAWKTISRSTKAIYLHTSDIRRTLVGNTIVDHSDVVGAAPVGAAPTTSSFPTLHLASIYCTRTIARRDEKHLGFGAWCGVCLKFDDIYTLYQIKIVTSGVSRPHILGCQRGCTCKVDNEKIVSSQGNAHISFHK